MNPPQGSGAITTSRVRTAAEALGADNIELTNLFPLASKSFADLSHMAQNPEAWESAKQGIVRVLESSDFVLLGWGVKEIAGPAAVLSRHQKRWVLERAHASRTDRPWVVGGEPRHPSRWHQFVSDKYGRTTGGSFEERLRQVLGTI